MLAFLSVLGIYTAIGVLWALVEYMIYGRVEPRIIDTIVGVVLAISLYNNFN
jgi:uncharacterized membrane protein YccC